MSATSNTTVQDEGQSTMLWVYTHQSVCEREGINQILHL